MRLKSWESPRRGRQRNNKSKQASARLRQLKKRNQHLRNQLKVIQDRSKPSGSTPGGFGYGAFTGCNPWFRMSGSQGTRQAMSLNLS